jgi:hypothetical protein
MDKRKANGTETPENEDRALKRRRLAVSFADPSLRAQPNASQRVDDLGWR